MTKNNVYKLHKLVNCFRTLKYTQYFEILIM